MNWFRPKTKSKWWETIRLALFGSCNTFFFWTMDKFRICLACCFVWKWRGDCTEEVRWTRLLCRRQRETHNSRGVMIDGAGGILVEIGLGAVDGKWISRSHLVVAIQIAKTCYNYRFDSILSQNMDQHSFLRKITALTLEIAFLHPNIWWPQFRFFFDFIKFTQIHLTNKMVWDFISWLRSAGCVCVCFLWRFYVCISASAEFTLHLLSTSELRWVVQSGLKKRTEKAKKKRG